jgi:hypothetical protein
LRLEPEGFYFHDLACSDFSARILRIILELALEHSEVQIEGFGPGGSRGRARHVNGEFAEFDALIDDYRDLLADPGRDLGTGAAESLQS